jgi:hypothetical protein
VLLLVVGEELLPRPLNQLPPPPPLEELLEERVGLLLPQPLPQLLLLLRVGLLVRDGDVTPQPPVLEGRGLEGDVNQLDQGLVVVVVVVGVCLGRVPPPQPPVVPLD